MELRDLPPEWQYYIFREITKEKVEEKGGKDLEIIGESKDHVNQ